VALVGLASLHTVYFVRNCLLNNKPFRLFVVHIVVRGRWLGNRGMTVATKHHSRADERSRTHWNRRVLRSSTLPWDTRHAEPSNSE